MSKKVRNPVPWMFVVHDLNGEEIVGNFYKKELKKADQNKFKVEKIIERKSDKVYVTWKGYDKLFNSWIDKKRHKRVNILPNQSLSEEK